MSQRRKLYSFWIDPEQSAALKRRKEQDGITESEQIRRAIAAWLGPPGSKTTKASKKTAPRRALTRRRA